MCEWVWVCVSGFGCGCVVGCVIGCVWVGVGVCMRECLCVWMVCLGCMCGVYGMRGLCWGAWNSPPGGSSFPLLPPSPLQLMLMTTSEHTLNHSSSFHDFFF